MSIAVRPASTRRRFVRPVALAVLLLAGCDQASMPEFRSPIVFPPDPPATARTSRTTSSGTASAASRPTIATAQVGAEAANLRSGPGTRYGVVGSAAPGVRLEVLREQAGWLEIRNGARSAWIAKSLTSAGTAPPAEPAAPSTLPAASSSTASPAITDGTPPATGDVLPDF